jgi:hypothetical protein
VLYHGAPEVLLLDADGKVRDRLPVPEDVARAAWPRTIVEQRAAGGRQVLQTTPMPPPWRFTYAGAGRLEYHLGQERLSWDLGRGKKPVRDRLPPHRWPVGAVDNANANSTRFTAHLQEQGRAVAVREWAAGAVPAVLWRADPEERILQLAFGGDDQALFVLTRRRLVLLDPAGGATAEAAPADPDGTRLGGMIPCPGGVAVVERRAVGEAVEPPRLVFWGAALPEPGLRALRHEEAPRCLALDGTGPGRLLAVGTPDHLVQTWRGPSPLWEGGLPYLGEQAGKKSRRLRVGEGGIPPDATGLSQRIRVIGARQQVVEQYLAPASPFRWWGFAPGGTLVVERTLPAGEDRPRVLTELYPADGRPEAPYGPVGKGRLLGTTDDRRLGVVVAEEKEGPLALQVWSVAERRRLARLGRYALPGEPGKAPAEAALHVTFLTTPTRKDYLLLAQAYPRAKGAELEVWRLGGRVERVGRLSLPALPTGAFLTPDEARAVVWRPRFAGKGPYFARVLDLTSAARVCDLEGFEVTGKLDPELYTATHLVFASRLGLSDDPNEPVRIGAWDLRTGKRTRFDAELWHNQELPGMTLSPDGTRLVVWGRLHESGAAHVRCYDLAGGKLLFQSPRFPAPARS